MTSKQLTKHRIEIIKSIPYANGNLLVLSDYNLFYVEIQSSIKPEPIFKDKIQYFAINEFSKAHQFEIVAITRKKEGVILSYNPKNNKFE